MAATCKEEVLVPYKFYAREYQLGILAALDRGCKRAVWCAHRRSGKDLTIFNYIIKELYTKPQTAYYIFPTYSQAKKVLWDGMTKDGRRFLDFIPHSIIQQKNATELKIRFTNGSLLQLCGSDDIDKLVGTNPSICVFSEFALQRPDAWTYLRPIMAENGGTAIFISTPRGKNHFYELIEMAKNNPEWFVEILGVDDTQAITKEAIDKEVADGMSPDMVAQEFYCSFELGVEGSYYAKYLQEAKDEERITSVPWDRTKRVCTSFDIGYGDSTSIIWFQVHGQIINVIDFHEDNAKALDYYAKIIADKPYNYDKHFLPHDGAAHDAATGFSYRSKGRELGISFTVLPRVGLAESIETVRGKFSRVWIDKKKCDYLLKCLENYRKAYDDRHRVYQQKPVHDWTSHACDAFRMMCLAVDLHFDAPQGPTDQEVQRMYDLHNPRFG